jgi:hypothetical protein
LIAATACLIGLSAAGSHRVAGILPAIRGRDALGTLLIFLCTGWAIGIALPPATGSGSSVGKLLPV